MPTSERSTTGCSLCKARRKKCDETKPQCLRCLTSGSSCRYDFIEYHEGGKHRVKRTKPAPQIASRPSVKASRNFSVIPYRVDTAFSSTSPESSGSDVPACFRPLLTSNNKISLGCGFVGRRGAADSLFPTPVPSHSLSNFSLIGSSITSSGLARPPYDVITIDSAYRTFARIDEDSDDDIDPERVQDLLYKAPGVDRNVKANSLPFVLHCYSQWAIASVFEPRKIMHIMRDQVISQFSAESTRTRTILIANLMDIFTKNFTIEGASKSILNRLASDVQKSGAAFMATTPSFVPALDRQNAIHTLDSMLEILGFQLDTQPSFDCVQSLENAAPVFRRACPDPPGKSINLVNILLDLNLNLRYFATLDILMGVVIGRPTCFTYEVPFSPELCERIYRWQLQGNYGLQWLHGFPDQFIMLFAWINTVSETPEASSNVQLVTWIEQQLPQIKIAIDESGDPLLRVRRMIVLESWRFAVLIYLYMVLCKADAHDSRVIRAQKGYMRLIKGVRPGRNPDVYLTVSMAVVGVVTTEEQDRDTLRRRILSVREYAERGTAGNDIVRRLEDIWARTRDEGRPAVWSDLKIAQSRLTRSK